ncbi:MAG: YceD family protein [Betaproteobacteria bacterium]|nr:YceD family protein [Betaproteobacteria bacterium]
MNVVLNDPGEFCRKNLKQEGRIKVAELERLSAVCAGSSGELQWVAEGKINPSGYLQLDLAVKGRIDLMCQRCLEAFPFDLDSRATIILAGSEAQADEIEDRLEEDDPTEVIVGDKEIDMLVLVEDEALLTIPLSPRHDVCPHASRLVFGEKQKSPFSVLQGLKTGKSEEN